MLVPSLRVVSIALLLPLMTAACAGGAGRDGEGLDTLRGELTLPDAATLPPTARAEVRLVDVSRSEPGRPFLVASQVLDGPLTQPLEYRLQWNPATERAAGDYAVSGRIFTEGRTLYASETLVSVPEGLMTAGAVPVQLSAVAAPPEETERQRYSLDSMPDVKALRDMPASDMPRLREDDLYGDYGTSTDPLPSDPLDGNRVITPLE